MTVIDVTHNENNKNNRIEICSYISTKSDSYTPNIIKKIISYVNYVMDLNYHYFRNYVTYGFYLRICPFSPIFTQNRSISVQARNQCNQILFIVMVEAIAAGGWWQMLSRDHWRFGRQTLLRFRKLVVDGRASEREYRENIVPGSKP